MKAIILAGGYGTRLFPLTLRLPKALVPVGGRPVIEHLVRVCAGAGITDISISLNTNQKQIEAYLQEGSAFGARISYIYEETRSDEDKLGAIGAIQYALSKTGIPDECLLIGGDNVFYGLDLGRMRKYHAEKGAAATIALYSLRNKKDVEQYSAVNVGKDGRIIAFQEKPKVEKAVSSLASIAVYHLSQGFMQEYLPAYIEENRRAGRKPDKLGDLWQHYSPRIPIYGHSFAGMWGDTNSAATYAEAHKQAMQFITPEGIVPKCTTYGSELRISPNAEISPEAVIKAPCIVEDGCAIEAGAVVGNGTHLMRNARVGKGAVVNGSVLFRDCIVGERARVTDSIADIGAEIGPEASVERYSLIGLKAIIGRKAKLLTESRVWPLVELGAGTISSGDVMMPERLVRGELEKERLF